MATAQHSGPTTQARFEETHWSVVLAANQTDSPQAAIALDTLCRTYWPPLYAFIRSRGHNPQEAQDLTQEFFVRFLKQNGLAATSPEKGRFRSFLLFELLKETLSGHKRTTPRADLGRYTDALKLSPSRRPSSARITAIRS